MNNEIVFGKIKSIVTSIQDKSLNKQKKPEIKVSCGDVLWVDWEKKIFTPWMCIVFYAARLEEDPEFSNTNWQFTNWNSETWLAVVSKFLDISVAEAELLINETFYGQQESVELSIVLNATGKPEIKQLVRKNLVISELSHSLRDTYPALCGKYVRSFSKNSANNEILMQNLGSLLESIVANDSRYQKLER